MLGGNGRTRQGVAVHQHQPAHRPTVPTAVRCLYHVETVGAEIAAAVLLMEQGDREAGQVHLLAEPDVFLHRPALQPARRDRFRAHRGAQRGHDVPWPAVFRQAEMQRQARMGAGPVGAQAGRRAQYPRAGQAVADVVEQRGGCAAFVDPAGDGADLQVGVDLGVHVHQVALATQVVDEVAEIQGAAVHRLPFHISACARILLRGSRRGQEVLRSVSGAWHAANPSVAAQRTI